MLKNIRLHLDKDEQKQALLDEKLATHILNTHKDNINAFQRNIPALLPNVQNPDLANYSIFINQYAEINIVDYGIGRTFYGFHPEAEVLEQISRVEQHCPNIVFDAPSVNHIKDSQQFDSIQDLQSINDLESIKLRNQQPPLPYEIECLVVLGCGLGIHLGQLLKQHKIKNLVIYEPELQYFQCSIMATSWQEIFALAKQHNTAIFLQLEKDGRDLIQDMNELIQHCAISNFHLYKHYNHEVFNSIYKDLSQRSWREITDTGFKIESKQSYLDFVSRWTPNIDLEKYTLLSAASTKLSNNLEAFKKYFPEIYAEYKDYTPKKWLPISNAAGEVNLVKTDSLQSWYSDSPTQDCNLNFDNFNEQPNKDGLVLGYKGNKLAHYIHYQFVKETEELLKEAEEEVGALPDNVPSIIMFGLGVGYQVEKLLEKHTVEKLFICEPNPDFFYASLFAIDWQTIFETIEKSESRIYLNIGDDGSNLFRDLLSQFYSIGPYILNSTYFYQSYYNASLNSAISQLREQLQVVISMGEYFDHAYYGIAHTKEGMRRKIPILTANPASKLSYEDKEVPIFVVGNGPSLDSSIDAIKEWQGQAIVVSCGTALQALHRHGITPDFHAEIEQNRSTYDWAVLIGDLDYLKNITLISCNGIHPDTCDLYKDVMVAFKEGESSTVSALSVLGRKNYEALLNSFPTVSNFVIDLFSTIGFTSIYLIGVDLGFVDVKHHHSKSSGYYKEDGEESYDFTKSANTSLIVPGNFRPKVNTKHEFKVSGQVIEQVTGAKPKGQEFYNCSDGAKIHGTLPLRTSELLIVVTEQQKFQVIEKLKINIFSNQGLENYVEKFEDKFSQEILIEELSAFEALLEKEVTCKEDTEIIIKKQKDMLFASYKNGNSLLFYYLYGTVNYANAVFTKLSSCIAQDSGILLTVKEGITAWQHSFKTIEKLISYGLSNFDISSFKTNERELLQITNHVKSKSLLIICDSTAFADSVGWLLRNYLMWDIDVTFCSEDQTEQLAEGVFDFVIYSLSPSTQRKKIEIKTTGRLSTIYALYQKDFHLLNSLCMENLNVTFAPITQDNRNKHNPDWMSDHLSIAAILLNACVLEHKCQIILPKYKMREYFDVNNFKDQVYLTEKTDVVFEYELYMTVYKPPKTNLTVLPKNGTRGKLVIDNISYKNHIYTELESKVFGSKLSLFSNLVPTITKDRLYQKTYKPIEL
ncbi:motility associated factor glycosyltransferase family protein [Paraglaciecola arctica]|uniref:motility associated factor glycosyltransferase family protein n=1 Tax=Paraglaciecola arctica TaxID=1128911 RepID=UPI001C079CAB|nr:6-hydroxymethylpterin diphosphokinase MptE-like protein [Paraglaciecola arctica]MBU3002082.1 DUF115 domain-containing protein [Paraglaciecola arctica]